MIAKINTSIGHAANTLSFSGLDFSGLPKPKKSTDAAQCDDRFESRRKSNVMIPTGTPAYFLHGTFTNSDTLLPVLHWFNNEVKTEHPTYLSYLPEVQRAQGIESSDPKEKTIPAYLLVMRDMGDFRFQVTYNNLLKLQNQLQHWQALPETEKNKAIAQYFNILPGFADTLAPVIATHLLQPVFHAPDALKTMTPAISLMQLSEQSVQKVKKEVAKLSLSERNLKRPIYDSSFLYTEASFQGKAINLNPHQQINKPNTVNIRAIGFEEIIQLEAYLLFIQEHLAKALESALKQAYTYPPGQAALKKRAESLSEKLMEKIAPQGMAFGHSQGGTVLHTLLLNYLANAPKSYQSTVRAKQQNDATALKNMIGRYIGLGVYFSAPLKGIPDEPLWGKKLIQEINGFESKYVNSGRRKFKKFPNLIKPGTSSKTMKWILWKLFLKGRPAVSEMREGSPLMNKLASNVDLLNDHPPHHSGVSIFSVFDRKDLFIEPSSSLLTDKQGNAPSNVFNLEVQAMKLPPDKETPDELMDSLLGFMGKPGSIISNKMPGRLKAAIHKSYMKNFVDFTQHHALIALPHFVEHEVGQQVMGDAQRQQQLLTTNNFEPLRYQSLVARHKSYHQRILDLPTEQAAAALQLFVSQHPGFLQSLISNIQEALPVENSASYKAGQILGDTLDLLEKMISDPALKTQYRPNMANYLKLIVNAQLEPLTPGAQSLSLRASLLLGKLFS